MISFDLDILYLYLKKYILLLYYIINYMTDYNEPTRLNREELKMMAHIDARNLKAMKNRDKQTAVSYTHLTLPTILRV